MFWLGYQELLMIAFIGVLVLGPKRLPEFFRSIGKVTASARRAIEDFRREIDRINPLDDRPAQGRYRRDDAAIAPSIENRPEPSVIIVDPPKKNP